jgi:hypothetical protein
VSDAVAVVAVVVAGNIRHIVAEQSTEDSMT